MPESPLAERISRFVDDPAADDFGALALAAFRELYGSDEAFRRVSDRAGATPESVGHWSAIPPVSATTEPWAGSVAGPLSGLQQWVVERDLAGACAGELGRPGILQLVPLSDAPPDRELTEICAALAERRASDGSSTAIEGSRVDVGAARSWLAAHQRNRQPAVLLASDASLERLLSALERQDLRFQLAFGSRVVVTRMLAGPGPLENLAARCAERLEIAAGSVIRQLRWAGVPTPAYRCAAGAGPEPQPWLRLEPQSVLDLTITGRPFRISLDPS